jgi:hypothetical protein
MLAGDSEATVHSWAAFAKAERGAATGTAARNHHHINSMGGSLTILRHHSLSKDEVGGIHPAVLRRGTMMARDAYGWHGICFYLVEDDADRASVVSMDGPIEPHWGCLFVRDGDRGPVSPLQGASDEISSNNMPPAREAIMAR